MKRVRLFAMLLSAAMFVSAVPVTGVSAAQTNRAVAAESERITEAGDFTVQSQAQGTTKTTKTTKTAKPAPKASKATAAKAAAEAKAAATFMVHSAPVKNVVEDAPLYFEKKLPQKDTLQVGYPLEKVDAMGLVTGTQKYVEDIDMPQNLLHVKVLGSPYAHAEIKKIDVEEAKNTLSE